MLCFRLLYATVLSSDVSDARARASLCVCVVHWHCTAQLSMFNMEKRFRNKIIIIIILLLRGVCARCYVGKELTLMAGVQVFYRARLSLTHPVYACCNSQKLTQLVHVVYMPEWT